MQILSATASRLRQAVARGWRALADVRRNQVRIMKRYYRYYRPQREWAVARPRQRHAGRRRHHGGASGPDQSLQGCGRDRSAVKGQVT